MTLQWPENRSSPTGTCRRTQCASASAWSAGECSPASNRANTVKFDASHHRSKPFPSQVGIGSQTLLASSLVGITALCARSQRLSARNALKNTPISAAGFISYGLGKKKRPNPCESGLKVSLDTTVKLSGLEGRTTGASPLTHDPVPDLN